MIYHRTANCLLTVCLTQGDKPITLPHQLAVAVRRRQATLPIERAVTEAVAALKTRSGTIERCPGYGVRHPATAGQVSIVYSRGG